MAFEIWFYRGLIGALIIALWWMIQRWIGKQEEYNTRIFQLLDKNEQAINRLNILLESKDDVCELRHNELEKRLTKGGI